MAKPNIINKAAVQVTTREVDFVTQFEKNWEHLQQILGILRPIKRAPNTKLKAKYAVGSLQSGNVGEGEDIPFSKYEVKEKEYATLTVEKYAKATTIEAINEHGYDNAVAMTDEEFRFDLTGLVTDRFYAYLNTGMLASTEATWQMALAMAKGNVEAKFKDMHRSVTGVVAFVNILDVYQYVGMKDVTIQNAFGFQYMKDFLGFDTVFLLGEREIKRGRVIATPVNNINLYYVDPGESDFARAGLVYTTSAAVGANLSLIGFHSQGNYSNATSESYALLGMTLFAEYVDAIAVIDVDAETHELGALTVTTTAGDSGKNKVAVSPSKAADSNLYKVKVGAAAATVAYGQDVRGWKAWNGTDQVEAATGQHITVVECDGAYKALKSGDATAK